MVLILRNGELMNYCFFIVFVKKGSFGELLLCSFGFYFKSTMNATFYKYQGTGNDFVIFDNLQGSLPPLSKETVAKLCHRRFGIGADGLMVLEAQEGFDFRMVYYNSDGNQSSMCGNGGRCLVKFAHDIGVVKEKAYFLAVDGPHVAFVKDHQVHLEMKSVEAIEKGNDFFYLNTGSPHYVAMKGNLSELDVFAEGRKIRYNDRFSKEGTNVNFVQLLEGNRLFVRTYERGVEDETYSCGTGVTACAIVSSYNGYQSPVAIQTLGGNLEVAFSKKSETLFDDVYLIGPAIRVFVGKVEI